MIAHALRLGGYKAEVHQREHSVDFLRIGIFLSLCTGLGLLSFFLSFGSRELIATYGLWYLLEHDGVALQASIVTLTALVCILYPLVMRVLEEREADRMKLFGILLTGCVAFLALYFYTTYIDHSWWLEASLRKNPNLEQSGDYRVFLTDDTFLVFLPIVVNNFLMGAVAWVRDGDFFATLHRRHLTIGIIPAALAYITMLPYDALQLDHLYLYVIASAMCYVMAFAMSLQLEYVSD